MPPGAAAQNAAIGALLRPRSIAIAGATADRGKLGSLPLDFLRRHGYPGALYPINPKAGEIAGLKCYGSPGDIEGEIDLLVVAVAAARIPELLEQCRPGQVKSALILSSGYAEIGGEGERLQRELRAQASARGIRFIGPNSVGLANLRDKVIPSISQVFDQQDLRPGPIAFVSQSGAVGTAITALAHRERLGIGYFVSTGNEGDLEFSDFCEYFSDDPSVKAIGGYLESVRDGARFMRAVKRATLAGKPVILIKVGTTEVGQRAVRSHTGALAGVDEAYRLAFRESGVVRAESIEQLIDYLKMFSAYPEPRPLSGPRPRVAVLSHSGGAGVLIGDTCAAEGLDMRAPSEALAGRLRQRLPSFASLHNPIDMTAGVVFDPALMASVIKDTMDSREYDATILCVNLIWRQGKALAEQLASVRRDSDQVLSVTWIAGMREPLEHLESGGVPVFTDPVRCARAISARLWWEARRDALDALDVPGAAATSAVAPQPVAGLRSFEAQRSLLERYGIAQAPAVLAADLAAARRAAQALGYPVAAKLVAKGLAHKSDVGGVALGIASEAELDRAYAALERIPAAEKEGVLVQKMLRGGCELFAGFKRDETFGPMVVFGLGGIYVEVLRDTVMRLAPFTPEQAARLIESARFLPMLNGARGRKPCDLASLARILSQLSLLAVGQPQIQSVDLNPIMASAQEATVVDVKVEV